MKKENKHPLDTPKEWKDFDITASPLISMNMMAYYEVAEKQCIFQAALDKEKYGIKKVEVVEEDGKFIINIYHNIKALAIELR